MDSPLKRVRLAASQTADHVAQAVGIVQSHYTRIENGSVGVSAGVAAKLVDHFAGKLTVEEVLYPERFTATQEVA